MTTTIGYLPDLAQLARDAGLKVNEVDGWQHRGHGRFRGVSTIVCHHTAGPAKGNMPSLAVVRDGRAGLAGPLCNYGLGRDGTVYVVAAGYAWHAGEVRNPTYANDYAIGIEAEATGTTSWPAVQLDAYARLCAALCEHYDLSTSRVLGHKEVCAPVGRKSDPNFDMAAFRTRVTTAREATNVSDSHTQILEARELQKKVKNLLKAAAADRAHPTRASRADSALVHARQVLAELEEVK